MNYLLFYNCHRPNVAIKGKGKNRYEALEEKLSLNNNNSFSYPLSQKHGGDKKLYI